MSASLSQDGRGTTLVTPPSDSWGRRASASPTPDRGMASITPPPNSWRRSSASPTPDSRGMASITPPPDNWGRRASASPTPDNWGRSASASPRPDSRGMASITPPPDCWGRSASASPRPDSRGRSSLTPTPDNWGRRASATPSPDSRSRLTVLDDAFSKRRRSINDISFNIQPRKSIHEMTPRMQAQVAKFEAMSDAAQADLSVKSKRRRSSTDRQEQNILAAEKERESMNEPEIDRPQHSDTHEQKYLAAEKERETLTEPEIDRPPSRRTMRDMDELDIPNKESLSRRRLSSDGEELRIYALQGAEALQGRRKSLKNKIHEIERRKSIADDIDALERRLSQHSESDPLSQYSGQRTPDLIPADIPKIQVRRYSQYSDNASNASEAEMDKLSEHSGRSTPSMVPADNIPRIQVRRYSQLSDNASNVSETEMDKMRAIRKYSNHSDNDSEISESQFLRSLSPYLRYRKSISELEPYTEFRDEVRSVTPDIQAELYMNEEVKRRRHSSPRISSPQDLYNELMTAVSPTPGKDDSYKDNFYGFNREEEENMRQTNTLYPEVINQRRKSAGSVTLESVIRRLSQESTHQHLSQEDDAENSEVEEEMETTDTLHPEESQERRPSSAEYMMLERFLRRLSQEIPRQHFSQDDGSRNEDEEEETEITEESLHPGVSQERRRSEKEMLDLFLRRLSQESPQNISQEDYGYRNEDEEEETEITEDSLHPGMFQERRRSEKELLDLFLRRLSQETPQNISHEDYDSRNEDEEEGMEITEDSLHPEMFQERRRSEKEMLDLFLRRLSQETPQNISHEDYDSRNEDEEEETEITEDSLHPGVSQERRRSEKEMLDLFLRRLSQETPQNISHEDHRSRNEDEEEETEIMEDSLHPGVSQERRRSSEREMLDLFLRRLSQETPHKNLPEAEVHSGPDHDENRPTDKISNEHYVGTNRRPSAVLDERWSSQPLGVKGLYGWIADVGGNLVGEGETQTSEPKNESETNEESKQSPEDTDRLQTRRKSTGNAMLDSILRRFSRDENVEPDSLHTVSEANEKSNLSSEDTDIIQRRKSTGNAILDSFLRRFSTEPVPNITLTQPGESLNTEGKYEDFPPRHSTPDEKTNSALSSTLAGLYEWLDERKKTNSETSSQSEFEVGVDAADHAVSRVPRRLQSISTVVYDMITQRQIGEHDQNKDGAKISESKSESEDEVRDRRTQEDSEPHDSPSNGTDGVNGQDKNSAWPPRKNSDEMQPLIEPTVSNKPRLSIGKEQFDMLVRRFSNVEEPPKLLIKPKNRSKYALPSDRHSKSALENTKRHQFHRQYSDATSVSEEELITTLDDSESELEYSWTVNDLEEEFFPPKVWSARGDETGEHLLEVEVGLEDDFKIGENQSYEFSTGELIQFLVPKRLRGLYRYMFSIDDVNISLLQGDHRTPTLFRRQWSTESSNFNSLEEQVSQAMSRLDGVKGWTTMDRIALDKKKKDIDSISAVTFCGCGFLGIYLVGAAKCLQEKRPHLLKGRLGGSSVGSIVATCIVCDIDLQVVREALLRTAKLSRSYLLGPFSPSFPLEEPLLRSLLELLPEDAHIKATGRLFLSLTRASTLTNEVVSEYKSRDELLRAVLCCCFLPGISGFSVPTFQDKRYIDGGMSNNIPLKGPNTLTINAFAGEFDICPTDDKTFYGPTTALNQTIYMSNENLHKFYRALVPPEPEALDAYFERGYNDALKYIS